MKYNAALLRRRQAAVAAGSVDVPHGSASTYRNWGCRCAECRAANAAATRAGKARRRGMLDRGEVSPPHGRESTYLNYQCRCAACVAEHSARQRERDRRRRRARRAS